MRPRIAVTAGLEQRGGKERVYLLVPYADAVVAAGGMPVVLPPTGQDLTADELAAVADGLLLSGGGDPDAALWGEATHRAANVIDPRRQRADLAWPPLAEACGMPALGICLGCQEMAVARGGRLIQHLPDEPGDVADHGGGGRPETTHPVTVEADSLLGRIVGSHTLEVKSTHHQAVREPGRGMRVVARSPDGVIEAIEDPAPGRFLLGVQWHPERLITEPPHLALFEALCRAAAERKST